MYLIRELLGLQLVEIGNAFGGRDHSTVIHSLEKVQQLRQETQFARRLNELIDTTTRSTSLTQAIKRTYIHIQVLYIHLHSSPYVLAF